MNKFWLYFFGFLTVLLVLLGLYRPEQLDVAVGWLGWWMSMLLWSVLAAVIIAMIIGAAMIIHRINMASRRQHDGAYALQRIRVGGFLGFGGDLVIIDPNQAIGPAMRINRRTGDITEHEPAAGWQLQAHVRGLVQQTRTAQAIWPGDNTRTNRFGAMADVPKLTAGVKGFLQPTRREQLPETEPTMIDVTPTAPRLTVQTALDKTRHDHPDLWVVAQDEMGKEAGFSPELHAHAAVVGNTGTGKTKSVGYLLALQAVRQGYHTIILDPDGGDDWGPFAKVAEWHETDREMFPAQVAALYAEFDRRSDGAGFPIFVIIEEYGDLINQLRLVDRKAADQVDAMLDTILRRGRKRKIHMAFIDQYPEKWSQQIVSGTKWRAVFQLGPNQGAKLQEYQAGALPDRGVFLLRGHEYNSVPADKGLTTYLSALPRYNPARCVISDAPPAPVMDEDDVIDVQPTRPAPTPAASEPDPLKWQKFTDHWFEVNPQYIMEPYGGISHLARDMAKADGAEDHKAYKSTAKGYFDDFRSAFADWTKQTTKE